MINNKIIVGICITKIEDDFRVDFLSSLLKKTGSDNIKMIVFNSPRDFYYGDKYDKGARQVYDLINYDYLDALVILRENFYDEQVVESIIGKAEKHNVPVILVHGEHENCYCIKSDYKDAYKELLGHLFTCHGIKDPVFIGGRQEDDPDTVTRLECFREVLAENGISYRDDMLYYGEYWDFPTQSAVQKILSRSTKAPDAFVCANDTMAMAVCNELAAEGYKVPGDIKVTGFDGLISAEYFMPRLSTCREDIDSLTGITVDLIKSAIGGSSEPGVYIEKYVSFIGESCGCEYKEVIDFRERARLLFMRNYETGQHEGHVYTWVDSVLDSDSINTLSLALSDYILRNSSVCLNEGFIMTSLGQTAEISPDQSFNEYIVISSKTSDYSGGKEGRFPAAEMVPDLSKWLEDPTLCVITPIVSADVNCGYYAVKTDDIYENAHKLFRVSKTMNIAFGALLNRLMKRNMQSSIINAQLIDQLTGLANLKGLTNWFREFSRVEANHNKTVMVSVYNIPQYKFIYENYGMEDIEEAVKFTADTLKLANKDNGFIARTGNDEFIVINSVDSEDQVSMVIDNAVSVFFGIIEGYNTSNNKDYYLEVNCGCTVAYAGWNSSLSSFIKLANAEMYMNKLKAGLTPVMKDEAIRQQPEVKTPNDLYSEFSILIEKNLFTYFFQPIIDARTGEICAYEALMRTSGGIKMSPLEILDIAKEYNRLYEIEKATMFNVMDRYVRDMDKFKGTKVFINTIPGNFLKKDDLIGLKEKYGQYISNFVFEITEQDTVSDEELDAIRSLGVVGNSEEFKGMEGGQIAVDDYGTGHSNIVNLLRYAPHIIKIDRFLISNIQNDLNKQMFVKSTIEFSKMNNIKVLAEGVETYEEMKTVIEFGVDLIQGYYTARPAQDPIGKIPDAIRNEVITENLNLSKYDNDKLTYRAHDGETISLYDLAIGKYASIRIPDGNVRIVGTEGQTFETELSIDDDANAVIIFDNISIKAMANPAITLGRSSKAEIRLVGENSIQKNGISVPANSSLLFSGDGDLNINIKRNGSVCIGSSHEEAYGGISFEHTGNITVELQLDNGICIGGGFSDGSAINFASGSVSILLQCVNSIGVGSLRGKADVTIAADASVTVKCSGKNAVGIGSFDGTLNLESSGIIDAVADGETCAACGVLGTGNANIRISGGSVSAVVHSSKAVCIGSVEGPSDITITDGYINAYGEGDIICGCGSAEVAGVTHIEGGTVAIKILSGCILQFGSVKCSTIITGGNILADKEDLVYAVNKFGEQLHAEHPGGDSFYTTVTTPHGEYLYRAEKKAPDDDLIVFLP